MNNRRKRSQPHIFRIQPQQNMMHSSIEANSDILDILPGKAQINLALLRNLRQLLLSVNSGLHLFLWRMSCQNGSVDQVVQPPDNIIGHTFQPIGRRHMKSNTRHNILSVFTLRIHHGNSIENLHRPQIAKIAGYRRSAHVNSETENPLNLPWSNTNNLLIIPHAHRNTPLSIA